MLCKLKSLIYDPRILCCYINAKYVRATYCCLLINHAAQSRRKYQQAVLLLYPLCHLETVSNPRMLCKGNGVLSNLQMGFTVIGLFLDFRYSLHNS